MMSKSINISLFSVFLMGLVMLTGCDVSDKNQGKVSAADMKRVVLVGASVGKAWDLPHLPQRLKVAHYAFESIAAYQYDKTEAIDELLMRPKRKFRLTKTYLKGFFEPAPKRPDVIIIKECAAYFPGDLKSYEALIKKWVKQIRDANIEVILATTVPVTHGRSETKRGQIEGILTLNDWIRQYAEKELLPLLDLEAALRIDPADRFLKDDLSTDGLHLNRKAYDILDKLLLETLSVHIK